MDRPTEMFRWSLLLAAAWLGGCGPWEEADDFQQRLRCGMEPVEVEAEAEEMGVTSFREIQEPNEITTHVLNQDQTFFEFYFGDKGLETVRQGASVGLTTGTSYDPRINLCTGEMTSSVSLTLKGSATLAGASIFVDGEPYWQLSNVPDYSLNIAVPTGHHEIVIKQEGYEPIIIPVNYDLFAESAEIDLPEPKKLSPGCPVRPDTGTV